MTRKVLPLILILAFAIILYYPALSFGYVWDDSLLFIHNIELLKPALNWHMLSQPVLPGTSYFRPLVFLTWFTEFHYFGQNTVVSHGINIFIYLLNIILLYAIGLKLFTQLNKKNVTLCASIAALLYAVHPALIETTAWVSGRFDLLVTCSTLLACLVYLQPISSRVLKITLLNICFLMALASKELGVVLPLILVCLSLMRSINSNFIENIVAFIRGEWDLILSFTGSFLIYILLRVYSVQQIYHSTMSASYVQNVIIDHKVPLHALSAYVFEAILPFYAVAPLHPMDSFVAPSVFVTFKIIVSLLMFVFCIYQAFIKNSAVAWLGVCALLAIFPVLHIIPLTVNDNLFHDRFMTLGLAFVALAVVALPYEKFMARITVLRPQIKTGILSVFIAFWLGLASISVHNILPFWKSDLTLWHWMYQTYPDHNMVRYSYYQGLYSAGQYQKIIDEARLIENQEEGLEAGVQIIYANALLAVKNPESFDYLQGIVEIMPKFYQTANNPRNALSHSDINLTPLQVAGIYNSLSLTYIVFKDNLELAMKYNKIADSYLLPTERFKNQYQRVAIRYLLDDKDVAISLYDNLNNAIPNNKGRYNEDVNSIIASYCEQYTEKSICQDYALSNPFK